MATRLEITKGGVKLISEVSTHPRPTPRQAWPIPDFPSDGTSLITLSLETVQQTTRKGIRVVSVDILPGGADAVWVLWHAAYQGVGAPDPLPYEQITVTAPKFSILIDPALPKAVHLFHLVRTEAGKDFAYPESSITTPDDAAAALSLEGILADDLISKDAESTSFKAFYDAIVADKAILDVQADDAGSSRTAYDAACATLTAAVGAISPAYTTLTVDHPLGSGGGATLLGQFRAVYAAADNLRIDIAKLQGSDLFLTPSKKRDVKAQWTRIKVEQAVIDPQADLASVSRSTYDTAITTLYTYLDGLTDVGGSAGGAWTGSTSTGDFNSYTVACGVVGTTLRADLAAIYAARDALLVSIGGTGLVDDVITGPQKVVIKADRDKYYNGFYTTTTGLKDQAIAAGVSWSACDTAIAALETQLGTYTSANGWNTTTHDWKNLNTLVLATGGGAVLRTKIADVATQWNVLSGLVINALSSAALSALAGAPALMSAIPGTCSAEYITATNNRTFAGAGNWTGTNWSVSGGAFVHAVAGANTATLGNAYLTAAPANGEGYQISADITTTVAGALTPSFGGVSGAAMTMEVGTLTDVILGISTTGAGSGLQVTPDGTWLGKFTNVSIKMTTAPGGYVTTKIYFLTAPWTDTSGVVGPAGKLWASTVYHLLQTGNVWQWKSAQTMADQIFGTIIAGAVKAGVVGAQALAALIAFLGVMQTFNYDGSTGVQSTQGVKMSGVTFSARGADGTDYTVNMDVAGNVLIAGHKALTMADRLFFQYNRIANPKFLNGLYGWSLGNETPTTGVLAWDSRSKTADGSGSATFGADTSGTQTKSLIQAFVIPPPLAGAVTNLTFETGWETVGSSGSCTGNVKVYIMDAAGTETLLGTYSYTSPSGATALAWTSRTIDISSYISAGGNIFLRFLFSISPPATKTGYLSVDEVSIIL